MSSRIKILLALLSFVFIFIASSVFMYFKYIHNKPKVKIIEHRTEVDPIKFDSALRAKNQIQK